jgi:hypothetical protein
MEKNDYVITSNSGYVEKKDFVDTGWIKDYFECKDIGTGTLWLNSRLDVDLKKSGAGNYVLTFILPLRQYD